MVEKGKQFLYLYDAGSYNQVLHLTTGQFVSRIYFQLIYFFTIKVLLTQR